MKCKDCGIKIGELKESGFCSRYYSKDYKKRHKVRIREYNKMINIRDRKKIKVIQRKMHSNAKFGGNRLKALERDNFKCQDCNMTQEEHIKEFGRDLNVDHIDGNGRCAKIKNHELKNLKTTCSRCHPRKDKIIYMKKKYGSLLKQDASEYRYPRIRSILNKKKKKLGTITAAKHELAKEMNQSFWTMDHMCYERKVKGKSQ